jgi:hypothetical protein
MSNQTLPGSSSRRSAVPRYAIEVDGPAYVVIRDLGPWHEHRTITNDVEQVVRDLAPMLGTRRLFYYDSSGHLDEIVVADGRFARFIAGGPNRVPAGSPVIACDICRAPAVVRLSARKVESRSCPEHITLTVRSLPPAEYGDIKIAAIAREVAA